MCRNREEGPSVRRTGLRYGNSPCSFVRPVYLRSTCPSGTCTTGRTRNRQSRNLQRPKHAPRHAVVRQVCSAPHGPPVRRSRRRSPRTLIFLVRDPGHAREIDSLNPSRRSSSVTPVPDHVVQDATIFAASSGTACISRSGWVMYGSPSLSFWPAWAVTATRIAVSRFDMFSPTLSL